ISYDADNHEFMVKLREEKVERIADYIPLQTIESGPSKGKVLVVGWGSTYGSIQSAVNHLLADGYEVAHAHIRYLKPFPKNLGEILFSYDKVLVPEINNGQLVKVLRDKFMIPAIPYNKIKGTPITSGELIEAIMELM
ncbi:MAG TPA: 2-oxoglutarate ferredoxin oxidoreductase subunit alpha, partial [Chitinophagales bacterium]|nr:2-oxoglutarate ferredoxin oxidoreductase subunit alpha [Chitinophagales bacterium]